MTKRKLQNKKELLEEELKSIRDMNSVLYKTYALESFLLDKATARNASEANRHKAMRLYSELKLTTTRINSLLTEYEDNAKKALNEFILSDKS